MPKDGDWIEVAGKLEKYVLDGQTYLTLRVRSVQVKAQRGAESVYQ